MQGVFISAFTFTPPVILGRQMLPFSCFHGLLLDAAGSSFLSERLPGIDDVILSAWICSHSFADGYLGTMDFKAIRAWGRKCRRLGPVEISTAITEFREYIDASMEKPVCWQSKDSKASRAPVWWLLTTFAQTELDKDEAAAWDAPFMKLVCYLICRNEIDGDDSLMTDAEALPLGGDNT